MTAALHQLKISLLCLWYSVAFSFDLFTFIFFESAELTVLQI